MPCDDNNGDDDNNDNDNDEYTNLSITSASCSFYSYTPHFPSPSPSFYYTLILISAIIPSSAIESALRDVKKAHGPHRAIEELEYLERERLDSQIRCNVKAAMNTGGPYYDPQGRFCGDQSSIAIDKISTCLVEYSEMANRSVYFIIIIIFVIIISSTHMHTDLRLLSHIYATSPLTLLI
jgi:hypothetical protein